TAYGGAGNDWIDGGYGGTGIEGRDTIYGDAGNDTLFGYDANDKLYGGADADTLYGGTENDELYFNSDATTSGSVRLWDGASGSSFSLGLTTKTYSYDTFFGDDGIDTLVLDDADNVFVNSPGDLNTGSGFGVGGINRLVGIEIVLAGAGADVIGLNHQDTGPGDSNSIYSQNITIAAEDGDDVIVSGSGNDLLIGGRLGTGAGTGNDTIFGGAGNDVIYGDSRANDGSSTGSGNDILYGGAGIDTIYGGDGDDTIYGGAGDDYAYGGAGDDIIFDDGSANGFMSADGADIVILNLNNAGLNKAASVTGADNASDGADRVFVGGTYGSVSFSMGGGDDFFVSNATGGSGIDRVSGQSGNDVISTWQGNDFIDGGVGSDALWGGAGGDTIYGGPDTDFLYGGTGDNDQLYGGAGIDYYYWARYDGQGDQIWDDYRGTATTDQSVNALVVFSGFDTNGNMIAGDSVFETDGVITDNIGGDDMVRAYDLDGAGSGTMWRLEILQGSGAGNYVDFDQRDISNIMLWNHEAAPGTPVVTQYVWNDVAGTYLLA
ncbi:MAG: calcium-binding protein, partial [Reyranellaceae bacterium]